ncbi:MAG: hypothetical protein HY716_12755 [Planctomycetes bacterium]|nr:hypothetical protein [Planctomycetota bacterium]
MSGGDRNATPIPITIRLGDVANPLGIARAPKREGEPGLMETLENAVESAGDAVSEAAEGLPVEDLPPPLGNRNGDEDGYTSPGAAFPRNYSADFTIDEFYVWHVKEGFHENAGMIQTEVARLRYEGETKPNALRNWEVGRYYVPAKDAIFTSGPVYLASGVRGRLPPPSGRVAASVASSPAIARSTPSVAFAMKQMVKLLGVSWTCYADDVSRKDGTPLLYDWKGPHGSSLIQDTRSERAPVASCMSYNEDVQRVTPTCLKQDGSLCALVVRVRDEKGNALRELAGPDGLGFTDAGFSATLDPVTGAAPIEFDPLSALEYEVRINPRGLERDSILLATPVFDDVTFYFTAGEPEYLGWRTEN